MGWLPAGDPVPLSVQLPLEDGSQFCRATIYNSANTVIAGPIALPYIAKGNYGSSSFLMPNIPWIKVIYEVFTDSGYTTLSSVYGESSDVIYLDVSSGGGGGVSSQSPRLIGLIGPQAEEGAYPCNPCQKPFDIVQGADVLFNVLFLNQDTNLPFDLSSASSISAKFLNTDGTFLILTLAGGVSVLSPANLGQIQISIEGIQTALLQYGRVSMEITIMVSGSTYIVQFPYLLNILQSVFN